MNLLAHLRISVVETIVRQASRSGRLMPLFHMRLSPLAALQLSLSGEIAVELS